MYCPNFFCFFFLGIVVALRLITNTGSISEAVTSGATVTAKRGFPDVIMPGDVRNDLYLTLERAEFERGGKSTAKNVLATVSVYDVTGQVINVSSGSFFFLLLSLKILFCFNGTV